MDVSEQKAIILDRIIEGLQDMGSDEAWLKRVAEAAELGETTAVSDLLSVVIGVVESEFNL